MDGVRADEELHDDCGESHVLYMVEEFPDEDQEYEVERILASRAGTDDGTFYLVKWTGCMRTQHGNLKHT
eukprot:SAG11_NODE_2714_length_3052_cov_1.918727_3_plen_70_part_00